jgi:hypothetical protein
MVQTPAQELETRARVVDLAAILPYAIDCTVLTPSGTVLAKGRAAPRQQDHLEQAYKVRLTQIEPAGVLEAMVYGDHPDIVLRTETAAEVHLRIDHITGPPPQREFFCQLAP